MSSSGDIKETRFLRVVEEIDSFCRKLDEKIENQHQQLKARRKNNEMERRMAQELKLNSELTQQISEISKRSCELDRICGNFETSLTIADSDRNRLDHAKEIYQIAKELTGIRYDFSAPSDVVKGYIKSEPRHLLQAFEQRADPDQLWHCLRDTADPAWSRVTRDKENRPRNK